MSEQTDNAEDLGPPVGPSSGSGSSSPTPGGPLSTDVKQPDRSVLGGEQKHPASRASRATGPRTPQGKERSKRNALKHGIFSNAVLLKDESRVEFDGLSEGLREDLQPEGTLETVLVDKLAVLLWRLGRLFIAETAEIRNRVEFLDWDEEQRQTEESNHHVVGLIKKIANPKVLERCLELLEELKADIEGRGFHSGRDSIILNKLYGYHYEQNLQHTLYDWYRTWLSTAELPEDERRKHEYAEPKACESAFLGELEDEIERLERYKKARAPIESERLKLEALRRNVPDGPQLDRLLKYEASLERAFDRTLSQLERLQRMRLGQPVPPPIKVNVSAS